MQVSVIHDNFQVFCDKTGFSFHLALTKAWSPRGVTPSVKLPGNRGRNISVISAIGTRGMLGFELVDGAFDAVKIASFFETEIFPRLAVGNHVVMGNARIHHSVLV
jgi:hypothetical protein